MGRQNFATEQGYDINDVNGEVVASQLAGTAAPGGDTGPQDAAPIGSLFQRTTGQIYKKIANAGATSDWQELTSADLSQLSFRSELVRAATVDVVAAGTVDPTGFSDNESGLDGNDFAVGEYLLGDVDGTPALFEVTAVNAANDITVAAAGDPLTDNDALLVRVYLPDSPGAQEQQAFVMYNGSTIIKLGDVNWDFATGINISGGFSSAGANGPIIAGTDNVETALEKLEGDIDDVITALGISKGDASFGAFVSPASLLLASGQTAKQLFQRLGELLAQLRGVEVTGVTGTLTDIDTVPVASVRAVKWFVVLFETATPTNVRASEVYAVNDGATNADDTVYAKLKIGNVNQTIAVDVNAGNMRLRASSSTGAGVTVIARRIEVIKSVL